MEAKEEDCWLERLEEENKKERELAEMCKKKSAAEKKVASQEEEIREYRRDIRKIKLMTNRNTICPSPKCFTGHFNGWTHSVPSSIRNKYKNM